MAPRVIVEAERGVAHVRLARPDKMNALDAPMFSELAAVGSDLAGDTSVRAVVLSGDGRAFCAGLDMASFAAMATPGADSVAGASGGLEQRLPGRITNWAQEVAQVWADLPAPVVAAVHGHCLGGGLQIALGADIRIVAPDAKLSVLEIRWGLLADMTGLQALPRLVGLDVAKELAFTGRMVSGTEAAALGLATRVAEDPLTEAMALAREIAGKSPEAIRGSKALLNLAGTRPLAESFLDESRRMAAIIGSPNQVEAVMAQMEGRDPVFADPTD